MTKRQTCAIGGKIKDTSDILGSQLQAKWCTCTLPKMELFNVVPTHGTIRSQHLDQWMIDNIKGGDASKLYT